MERYPNPEMDEYAGVLDRRLEALLADAVLVAVVAGVLGYVGGFLLAGSALGGLGGAILGLQFGAPILLLGYQVVLEGYYGRTLGKRFRGIVVVHEDGSSVSWGSSVVRNALRIVDALPVFYLLGIVVAYSTDDNQRLGDLAGSTVVVETRD